MVARLFPAAMPDAVRVFQLLATAHIALLVANPLVVTDRLVLDQQLQDAIYQIEHAQGVVKAIDQDSKQLAAAMIDGTKIVITTLQKFPFVMRGLLAAAGAPDRALEVGPGNVLSGPPPRPLPSYPVSVRAGEIFVQV